MVCFIEFLLFLICGLLSIILILKFFIWMILDLTEKEKIKRERQWEMRFHSLWRRFWVERRFSASRLLYGFVPYQPLLLSFYFIDIIFGYRVLTFPDFVSNQTRFYWHTNLDFLSIVSSFSISLSGYNALFFFRFLILYFLCFI